MDDSILEKRIRETLEKKSEEACVDTLTTQRIQAKVYGAIEEERNMKNRNWKKIIVAAAAICVLGSITAVAVVRPKYTSSHSNVNEVVRDYDKAAAMQKEFDKSAKFVEKFSNGYEFKEAVPKYDASHDENHNVLETGKSMAFTYAKKGVPDVTLDSSRITYPSENADQILALEDGTELKYHRTEHLFLPPDGKPSEEDLKLEAEGKLNIAYGSSEVERKVTVSVTWTQDGVTYCLLSFNENMSADEILQMAKEVAES